MPIYSLQAPDGNIYDLEAPEGASESQLSATLYSLRPEAANPPPPPKEGILAALKKGTAQVGSAAKTVYGVATGDADEAAKAALERSKEINKKYAEQVGLQKVLDTYKKDGLLSAAGETVKQIPLAIAEQSPNLAASYASALAGSKTGQKLGSVAGGRGRIAGGIAGGIAGIFAPSYVQSLGGNVERQAQEQVAAGKPIDINTKSAATTAIPQGAFDVVSNRILLGSKIFGKLIGIPEEVLAKGSSEAIERLAKERISATIAKGTLTGIAGEIPTEIPQQVLERYQAGLPLTGPEAMKEYGETAYQVALLGPLGIVGRMGDKSGAKAAVAQKEQAEAVARQAEQPPPPDTSSPDYAKNIATQYQAAEGRKNELLAQLRDIQKNSATETADRLHNAQIEEQVKAMTPELEQLATEYNKVLPNLPEPAKVEPAVVEGADIEGVAVEQAKKPTMTVGDALDDPVGRFSKDELISRSPKIAQYVDSVRKKQGKPEIDSYSIEDIRNAMPNQLPDAEKADLNSLIAAKTGYVGGMKYVPEDVIKVAKQKNIDTTTTGFKYFLQRATGENEIASMSQPQLHSAFKALAELPRFEEVQILPEMTNATIYNPEQYTSAVSALQGLVTKRNEAIAQEQANLKEGQQPKLKPVSVDEAQSLIKKTAKLKSDDDIKILFQDANRKGDIDLTSDGNVTLQAKGPQAEFNIEEGAAPAEKTGFNVMRGDKRLYFTENEEDAAAKAASLGKSATPAVAQIEKAIAKENSSIAAGQRALSTMESNGLFNTPQYQQASARQDSVVANAAQNIKRLNEQRDMLQQSVVVNPTGRVGNKKVFTVKEPGVSQKSFDTREEAERHALENLPAKRLNELAGQTKAPGFANRLKKEQERRKNPPKPFLAEKPEVKKEPEVKEEPKVNPKAEELQGQLLPMLRKFGLGDVALKIEEGMKDEGSYVASTIKIALDANNPVRVLRHESIHGLKDLGFFTPGQWKVLENQADKVWINKYLKQRNIDGQPLQKGQQSRFDAYQNLYANDSAAVREEAIADAFADFDVNGAPKGLFAQLLNAMRKFFRNLRSAFTGAGYETADDVFGKVERGELKATKAAEKTEETKKSLVRKAVKDESEISTQNPQAKNRLYDPLTDMLSIDEAAVRESMAQNPELEKNMIETIKSYGFIPANTKDEDVIKVFKDNIVNNLLHLYNRVPEDVRQRSKLWYDGANRIAIELGARYDMSKEQVSGILAAMSPQKDWFQNVSMAERAIEILTNNGDATWTPQMMDYARSYINEAEDRKDREKRQIFFDKRISEMSRRQVKLKDMSVKDAAAFVRAYDEAFHDRKYRIVTPEGGFGGFVMNKNVDKETGAAKTATMMWSTYSPIEKTVSIFRDPSRENISQQLGEEHKIRSFYNNIVSPNSPIGHVTIDTHAVAAGLYEALAGSDPEVLDNFGGIGKNTKIGVGGTYGLIADAYREAARQVGLKPREMQSITWEAVRGMFPENIKNQIKKPIRAEWTKFRTGEQSFDETRRNIEALGERADRPDWFTSGEGEFVEDGGGSFDISFTPEGGVRLRKGKELVDKAIINLSAVTKSIPGLDLLHTRALNGDAEAYAVLQNVAASTLKHLLSGTNARVTVSGVKGVYESDREPAIVAQVRFKESDTTAVLAALAKFADNFNQEQIHVRTKTAYKVGHDFGDGTYATPVYTVKLKNELTEQDIVDIVNNAGLKGFSVSANELTAYHVQGEENDTAGYKEFLSKLEGIYESYGADDGRLQFQTQRLAVYGRGYGARLGYADISGIVRPKQDSDKATPRIIGEYLTRHPVKAFEQKALTKAQVQEQTVLKDVFQALPKNDLKKPIVRNAYEALAKEVKRQYEALPIKVELTDPKFDENENYIDIYKNSAEMRKDVSLNNTFKVLKTDANTFGPEGVDFTGHPLLGDSGMKDINGKTMLYNDLLRAVHDYFAHNLSDTEFGPKGEFAAWKNHMATTTDPLARWALTNETRAQNAWQNFRPEVKNVALKERGFADQKASLPPVAFTLTGDEAVDAPMLQYIGTLNAKQKLGSLSEKSPLVNKLPSLPEAPVTRASLRTAPDTPEFKRFFGDSKIVDADGNPRVMYHGTAQDITTFKPKQAGAIFLTDSPQFADEYAETAAGYKAFERQLSSYSPQELAKARAQAIADVKSSYGFSKEAAGLIKEIKSSNPTGEASDFLKTAADKLFPASGQNIMPVFVRAERPFDYENQDHIKALGLKDVTTDSLANNVARLESDRVQNAIRAAGFDSFYIKQGNEKNLAVYDPTQIKSATGNEGTYDINNPDIRKSLRTNVKNDLSNMPNGAAITAIMNRVTPKRQEEGFIERLVGSFAPESFSYLRQKALDRYNRLNDYDKMVAKQMGGIQLLADQSAHWAALNSDLAAGVTASALGVGNRMGGIPVLKNGYTTISDENGTVKGAVEIFSPLAQRGDPDIYRLYQTWSAAKRGTRLLKEGRMEFLSPAEVKDALTLSQKYPEFESIQREWIKFNNGLVKYQVDTGVLSESAGAEFMKYSDYIPFYRQMDGEATVGPSIYQSISGVKAPKKLTGKGQAPLSDFLETVVRNTQSAIQAGMKNVAAQRAVQNAQKIGMAQRLNYSATAPNTITVLEKGLKVSYESADPLFIDAVSSLNLPELPFLSIISKPADLLRTMVTLDPGFMLANMMRDSVSAYVTSGAKMTPIASTIKNFGNVLMKNSPEYEKLLSAGVIGGYEFSRNIEASAEAFSQDLREKTGTRTGLEKALRPFTGLKGFLERGTEASDAATRIAVYKATLEETGNEAEAIRRALEVMNFNRKGSSAVVRIAAAGIPFLNARMQGLDVFFRAGIRPFSFLDQNATEQEKQIQKAMFIRGATIMALSVMYAVAVSGDPDYEGQEAETKDNNWIIPSLGIKVPIPFEVGTLFKTIPERIYRYAYGSDNTKDLADSMKRALLSTFAFNPIFQVVNPILEVRDNYSSFTQRPIIGEAMKGIAPEYQVGPGTTKMAELLGKEIGMSPIQIDHLYKGYTGTMGMYLADVMDSVYSLGDDNPKASKRFEQTPVLKRFLVDPEARGTVSAYYDLKTSVDQVVRTVNRLTKEGNPEVGPYLEKNASLYAAREFISDMDKQMQELQSYASMVRNAPMDADAKRDALSRITRAQNELTKNIQDVRKAVQP